MCTHIIKYIAIWFYVILYGFWKKKELSTAATKEYQHQQ